MRSANAYLIDRSPHNLCASGVRYQDHTTANQAPKTLGTPAAFFFFEKAVAGKMPDDTHTPRFRCSNHNGSQTSAPASKTASAASGQKRGTTSSSTVQTRAPTNNHDTESGVGGVGAAVGAGAGVGAGVARKREKGRRVWHIRAQFRV